ncbi:hypothetical protein Cantr_09132 [Candida viswanathii]|uniref:Uncharacterized protein n=1 Tax=Candida viswanathii TaxID=5486 RepID=A0A367Y9B3_9ASCO|nr:hypothetical protein Cantr_09132 [Candida viswanathii]
MILNSLVTANTMLGSHTTTPNKIRRVRLLNNTRSVDEINQRLARLDLANASNLRITKYHSSKNTPATTDKPGIDSDDITPDNEEEEKEEQEEKLPLGHSIDPYRHCWDFEPEPICAFPGNIRRPTSEQQRYDSSWKEYLSRRDTISRMT